MHFDGEDSLSIIAADIEFQSSILYLVIRRSPFKSSGSELIITIDFFDFRDNTKCDGKGRWKLINPVMN